MGKLYTLDGKLLTETPEIRVGEKVYPIDNRQKTVAKLMAVAKTIGADSSAQDMAQVLTLALGADNAKEIDGMNIPYPAYISLFELIIAAVTGEEPERAEGRFQDKKEKN